MRGKLCQMRNIDLCTSNQGTEAKPTYLGFLHISFATRSYRGLRMPDKPNGVWESGAWAFPDPHRSSLLLGGRDDGVGAR